MLSMKRTSTFFIFAMAMAFLSACTQPGDQPPVADKPAADMDTLVSAEWLREHIDDPDLVVIDATVIVEPDGAGNLVSRNGKAAYDAGHIPTAVFADLKGELADADSTLDFAIPSPEQFAQAMGALGVGDNSRVVLYDANGMSWAARVWWMLRWIGFDQAALLDGGLNAWTAAGGELSTEATDHPTRELTVRLRPELIVGQDEVRASIEDDSVTLIDATPAPHYRGEWAMYDRPGHIRGAENVPVPSLFDDSGRFRSQEELATLFDGDRNTRTITYCGGGIAASSDAFVLTRLGFADVAIYGASLQEWAADPDNPMDVVLEFEEGAEDADE
jgi:thiosulfate/3-mercaptopyruvate sulfurtransferase